MGSQACWNARVAAPPAIVVKTPDGFRIAERGGAWQSDRSHGGSGPVVISYTQAPGLPYRTEAEAQLDATLILKSGIVPDTSGLRRARKGRKS